MPKRNVFILAVLIVGCLLAWLARDHAGHGRRFAEVLAAIDTHALERVEADKLFEAAMDGVFSRLDEHSGYIRGSAQVQLESLLDQELCGVGLELAVAADTRQIAVLSPIVASPAWRAGIVSGDMLVAIDGVPTSGMTLDEAVGRLRGREGSRVLLTVTSTGSSGRTADPGAAAASRDMALFRERVVIDSVRGDRRRADGSWDWWLEGEDGIAYLRVTSFGERTAEELAEAAEVIEAQGRPRGVVIDLRGNGGGLLAAAVAACDMLVDEGVIVSTRGGPQGDGERRAGPGHVLDEVPIVVLIDGLTASAAEIVAACLQDSGRATIVGGRTYGKGTVQTLLPLSDGRGIVKLTTAEYLRPSQATIHRDRNAADADTWGVSPADGWAVAPTGQQVERLRAWRQARDVVPPPGAAPTASTLPRDVDVVLRRGLDAFGH